MPGKKQITGLIVAGFAGVVIVVNSGAMTLVDSDFQNPIYANGTTDPAFSGWSWYSSPRSRQNQASSDVPGVYVAGSITNQVIQFEYTDDYGTYDISLNWTNTHTYMLRLNASPQSWSGTAQRYIIPSLLQQDNTVLWTTTNAIPLYDDFGRKEWSPLCTFEYVIQASNFTAGAQGQPLRLKILSSGTTRGVYWDNVLLVLTNLPPDTTPPTPDPMTWSNAPAVVNFTNNTMTATIAIDTPYGVEYFFENTNTSENSGWRSGPTGHIWTDVDLPPGSTNSYRVKARDKSPNLNETAWSAVVAVTNPAPDVTAPTPDPMTWSVDPVVVDSLNIYMVATTASDPYLGVEYLFTNTVTGASSGWQSSSIWYQQYQDYGTPLTYKVKARDLSPNQNETAWSAEKSVTVPTPTPPGLLIYSTFQVPTYSDSTANPFFVGWTWNSGTSVKVQVSPGDGVPGDSTNRVIQFEQLDAEANYTTDHPWAERDVYELTINAAPQYWSGNLQRYLAPSIRQPDSTVLWSTNVAVPLTNDVLAAGLPWPEELTFTFTINASEFSTGTEGENLVLKIDHTGQRGIFIDNVQLVLVNIPPAGSYFIFR